MNKIFLAIMAVGSALSAAAIAATDTQMQPQTGSPAPDFNLTTSDGSQVSLNDYKGKWVVLYFYPKDMKIGRASCRERV